jgi:hypothetical protein
VEEPESFPIIPFSQWFPLLLRNFSAKTHNQKHIKSRGCMQTATEAKCKCQHCDQSIAFDSSRVGESIACPGCGMDTLLFIPNSGPLPELPVKSEPQNTRSFRPLIKWSIGIVVVFILLFLWSRFTSEAAGDDMPSAPAAIVGLMLMLCGVTIGTLLYFVPALVAWKNKKRNFAAILVLNLCAGWTFIGWVVALVWACTVDPEAAK